MFDRILKRLLHGMVWFGITIYSAMALSITYEVVMRYFLHNPTRWSVDFSEYALVWIGFLPAAWVLYKDGHVKLDMVLTRVSPGAQRLLNILTSAIGTIVMGLFCWYSTKLTIDYYQIGEIFFKSIVIPKWPIFTILPFCSLVIMIVFARKTWLSIKSVPHPKRVPVPAD